MKTRTTKGALALSRTRRVLASSLAVCLSTTALASGCDGGLRASCVDACKVESGCNGATESFCDDQCPGVVDVAASAGASCTDAIETAVDCVNDAVDCAAVEACGVSAAHACVHAYCDGHPADVACAGT